MAFQQETIRLLKIRDYFGKPWKEDMLCKKGKTSCGVGPALRARSPTARSAYLPLICRVMVTLSSIGALSAEVLDKRPHPHDGS